MKNIDRIRKMPATELKSFLENIAINSDKSDWLIWFDKKYCSNCEPVFSTYKNIGINNDSAEEEVECAFCEINGECRFFPGRELPNAEEICELWLNTEEDSK